MEFGPLEVDARLIGTVGSGYSKDDVVYECHISDAAEDHRGGSAFGVTSRLIHEDRVQDRDVGHSHEAERVAATQSGNLIGLGGVSIVVGKEKAVECDVPEGVMTILKIGGVCLAVEGNAVHIVGSPDIAERDSF